MTEPMTDAELVGIELAIDPDAIFQSTSVDASTVRRIIARLDAERSRADAAEAARDAALARAMPEWKRMATVEEVRSLPEGNFLVADDEMFGGTEAFCRRPGLPSGRPRFFGTTCDRPWADRLFVGAWISGPLPSLPIPPTEDTTHDRH